MFCFDEPHFLSAVIQLGDALKHIFFQNPRTAQVVWGVGGAFNRVGVFRQIITVYSIESTVYCSAIAVHHPPKFLSPTF